MENIETKETFSNTWEKLGISNDFLFGKVMQDTALCKELLQTILPKLNIAKIEYPELQKAINLDLDAKSVRLDVYVKDEKGTIYNIEMQVIDTKELPKRTRYYQSIIDLQLIDKGELYNKLKPCFIIFICPFDPFGKERHLYTFENICKEDTTLFLKDDTTKIFLNANGTKEDVSPKLKAFLDYVAGKKSEDSFVLKLEKAIKEAKRNREWRREFMTLLMRDQENMEKGRLKGIQEGIQKGIQKGKLEGKQEGRLEGIQHLVSTLHDLAITDEIILQKLQEKFQLSKEEAVKFL